MTLRTMVRSVELLASLFIVVPLASAQIPAAWTQPLPPFRIAGNLYYVGSEDLASYLVATHQGLILINSTLESNVPLIEHSIEELGFHFSDIKILLISHAHYDHCGASARILALTHAKYEVMDADVPIVESGGKSDFAYGNDPSMHFPPARVDRVLHDGDTVALGGTVLTAHLTAGHTPGTTTWTLNERADRRLLHVVIVGGPTLNSIYKLVDNRKYPRIAADYRRQFEVLKKLPCDIFLGAHGGYFGLTEKYARWKAGDKDAFIDPAGYQAYITECEQAFAAELQKQQAAQRE